jgi:hypothetical protein
MVFNAAFNNISDVSSLTAVIDCVCDLWQVDGSSLTAVIDCVGDLWQVDGSSLTAVIDPNEISYRVSQVHSLN